jgi:hypothetical protein
MKRNRTVCLVMYLLIFLFACDKREALIDQPKMGMSINFAGAIDQNWENEDGWFVINQLFVLKDRKQLSITLSKGYDNLSIVYAAADGILKPGNYTFIEEMNTNDFAQAEYYLLGSDSIYKCTSGTLTISEISENWVKGRISGKFYLPSQTRELFINGCFAIPPIY